MPDVDQETDTAGQARPAVLKRSLSLPMTTFYGLGNILGAGIYVLIGKVVEHAGLFAPLSFLLAALLACLTAFSYAELSARYPQSAGEAVYVQEGIGIEILTVLVGLLIMLAGVVSAAAVLRGFTGYLQVFIAIPYGVTIPVLVLVLGGLAVWGISESVAVAVSITVIEIGGLLLVFLVSVPELSVARLQAAESAALAGGEVTQGVFVGAFLAFYAFIGFEDMVNVAEEVRRPERNLPRAILLALLIAGILYFLVALVAVGSVPERLLAEADAPLAFLYQYVTGREPVAITLISLFAVINGALIQIIMASRVCYGMGCRHWLPAVFARVHAQTQTPMIATLTVAGLVLVMGLWLPIETLAKATSFLLLVVFTLVNLSLWRLKRTAAGPAGVFCVPAWVPAAGFAASLVCVTVQAVIDVAM